MLSHVHLGVNDFPAAFAFYAPLLQALGLQLKFRDDVRGWAGWTAADAPRPLLLIGRAFDGQPATPGNGQMLALQAAKVRPRCARTTTRTTTARISATWTATSCACAAMARNECGGCGDAVVRVSVRGVAAAEMDADRQVDGERLPGRTQRDAA